MVKQPLRISCKLAANEVLIKEMRAKGCWFEGRYHYMLESGEHTDVFIYPKRMGGVFSLRRQLLTVLQGTEYDVEQTMHICLNHKSSRIIRSVHDVFRVKQSQFEYPNHESGKMFFTEKQLASFEGRPLIVFDDVVRKGRALKLLAEICTQHGLKPVSIIAAINTGLTEINGIPVLSLVTYPIRQWKNEQTCKLCQEGNLPLFDPYHFSLQR